MKNLERYIAAETIPGKDEALAMVGSPDHQRATIHVRDLRKSYLVKQSTMHAEDTRSKITIL
jgi:hypothetical protein